VLCEKPLATTTLEARECCKLAAAKDLVLAVGMNRRFETGSTVLRCILNEGLLGSIREYEFEYGAPYDWNTASGFYFARAQAGGGVLLDYGVHMLDSVMDWFGPVVGFEYQDDNWGGGLEANTMLELQHCGAYGNVPGRLRLSRMYNLKNRLLITGTQYSAQIDIADQSTVLIHRIVDGQPVTFNARLQKDMERPRTTFFKQLDNFIQAVRGREKPVVDGWQALEVIDLIEKCYAQARRIPEPWSQICNSVTAP
jgi:predicted dehydrogenase